MKYCKETTTNHPISKRYPTCLIDYNAIISEEGYANVPVFVNKEIVLNLDGVEEAYSKEISRLEKNKSMDSAFCIVKDDTKQIVLVEYKFNHEDFKSLKLTEMVAKVVGSTEIIAGHMPIYYHYYFVFQHDLLYQAISRIYRMNPRPGNEYIAISIDLLKEKFF